MDVLLQHRGRAIGPADIELIREIIACNPKASRRKLSKKLCEAWNWRQPNGALRDMVCRSLMLALDRAGLIELPPVKFVPPNPLARRNKPSAEPTDAIDTTPVSCELSRLRPLEFRQVRRTSSEALFNSLIEKYHYLGYTQPVGEHLKYIVYSKNRPIACLAWSSSPRHLGCRDAFIRWSGQARTRNIRFLAYNTRFLILPFVRVPHLSSHILGRMAAALSQEWTRVYRHPIYFLETFVDPARFRATSYRAANWIHLGQTRGLGKDWQWGEPTRPVKEVFGYALRPNFRKLLGEVS
jgi:hypothetical protein